MFSSLFSTVLDQIAERYHDALVWSLAPARRRIGIAVVLALSIACLWQARRRIRLDRRAAADVVVIVRGDDAASVTGISRHVVDDLAALAGVGDVHLVEAGPEGDGREARVVASIHESARTRAPDAIRALLASHPGQAFEVGGSLIREREALARVGLSAAAVVIALAVTLVFAFRTLAVPAAVLASLIVTMAAALAPFVLRATLITRWALIAAALAAAAAVHQSVVLLSHARRRTLGGDGAHVALIDAALARMRRALPWGLLAAAVASIAAVVTEMPRDALTAFIPGILAAVAAVLFMTPAVSEDLVAASSRHRARVAVRRAWRRLVGDA